MRMTHRIEKINTKYHLTIVFDIGKEDLNYHYEVPCRLRSKGRKVVDCFQGQMGNNSTIIDKRLKKLESFTKERGYCALHIVCEPTGPYGHKLMLLLPIP